MNAKLDCFEVVVGGHTIYVPVYLQALFEKHTGHQLDIEKFVSDVNKPDLSDNVLTEYVLYAILNEMYGEVA